MKKLIVVILMILILLVTACDTNEKEYVYMLDTQENVETIQDNLSIEKLIDGVFVVSHAFPWDANSMILEMQTGEIVLIDTPYENEATSLIVEWIRQKAGQDVKITAINTGYHVDNLGGNEYLTSQNIKIIGTSKTVEMLDERGETSLNQIMEWLQDPQYKNYVQVYENLKLVKPTEVIELNFDEKYNLNFGDESLVLYYPEESHSPDNIVVYYPDNKILFGGCMVKSFNAINLGNTEDANIDGWENSIEKLKATFPAEDVKTIVLGHGEVGDYSLLDKTLELISAYK